jgi:hypothetical protein
MVPDPLDNLDEFKNVVYNLIPKRYTENNHRIVGDISNHTPDTWEWPDELYYNPYSDFMYVLLMPLLVLASVTAIINGPW